MNKTQDEHETFGQYGFSTDSWAVRKAKTRKIDEQRRLDALDRAVTGLYIIATFFAVALIAIGLLN